MYVIVTRWPRIEGPDAWKIHRREDKQPYSWDSAEKANIVCRTTFYNKSNKGDAKVVPLADTADEEVYF